MPIEVTRHFIRKRQFSPKLCARGSFRMVRRGKHRIVICCPRGHWRKGRCRVGTRAQSILHRR